MHDKKQELLEQLWHLTVTTLVSRIADGDASSQDLSIARQILKDHSITIAHVEESPLGELSDVLPFPTKHQTTEEWIDALPSSQS